jgi:DNA-binding transcriptional regulator YiaG
VSAHNQLSIVQAKEWISNRSDGGLSRDEFAAFIGVDTTTISRWESGKRKPSKDNADLFDRFKVIESIWYPNTDNYPINH